MLTLVDAAGKVRDTVPIAPELAGSTVELSLPSQKLGPGEYTLTVRDQKGADVIQDRFALKFR